MNSFKRVKLALGLVAVSGLLAAVACNRHASPEKRAEWITSKVSSELSLTSEQRLKLDVVKDGMLALRKEHEADRAQHVKEVKELILSEKLEKTKVKALVSQRQKSLDEGVDSLFSQVAAFPASLTPEQKAKAVSLLEKFQKHWE